MMNARAGVLLLLLLALSAARVAAADRLLMVETEASERLVLEIQQDLLNFRMPAAERKAQLLAGRPDGALAGYHLLAMAAFLKAISSDEAAHFDAFFDRADRVLGLLNDAPASPWRDYLYGETYLQRGVVFVKTGQHARAAWTARSAYKHFEDLLVAHPQFYEGYKSMGLLHLGIGILPSTFRGFLKILGYGGSMEQGIAELELAARRSRLNREASLTALGIANVMLNLDRDAGLAQLRQLHTAYPRSPFFAHLYGFLLLEHRRAADARNVLASVAARHDDPEIFYVDYVDFYLGRALLAEERFAEAERYFKRYLASHEGPSLRAQATLFVGLTAELQGRRADAVTWYRRVEAAREYDSDEAARRLAEERLAEPLDGHRRSIFLGGNAYDGGRYEAAVRTLRPLYELETAPMEVRVEAAYRLGRVYQAQEQWGQAHAVYQFVIRNNIDPLARWAPWAQFYIGQVYAEQGEHAAARQAFEAALAYKGKFDYYQALEQQAKAALTELEEAGG